ncbi:MAG TPA: ATP-binding cassette domain-containing protein, partial [Aestuariivirgaceae bacterium]|nr:ATP-binding cassette domain-containing protein [Aestuariivirgaceae bacterium]
MDSESSLLLRTSGLTRRFGGLVAVSDLNLDIRQNEILGLIGPNGAGKTTIFNLLTGVYEPTSGEIYFQGKRIDGKRPFEIAAHGISRTFQNIRLFPSMTVLDNVLTACHIHTKQTLADAVLRTTRFRRCEKTSVDYCMELLAIFDLDDLKDEGGTSLP